MLKTENNALQLGAIVWSKITTNDDDRPARGMITGILIRPTGLAFYVTWDDGVERLHYDIELTADEPERTFGNN